jgi:AcrR family transcriptional regulator
VAETRERILDAAMKEFSKQGVQATTMMEVARQADVSPRTVSNHFATHEELIEAVVAAYSPTSTCQTTRS